MHAIELLADLSRDWDVDVREKFLRLVSRRTGRSYLVRHDGTEAGIGRAIMRAWAGEHDGVRA